MGAQQFVIKRNSFNFIGFDFICIEITLRNNDCNELTSIEWVNAIIKNHNAHCSQFTHNPPISLRTVDLLTNRIRKRFGSDYSYEQKSSIITCLNASTEQWARAVNYGIIRTWPTLNFRVDRHRQSDISTMTERFHIVLQWNPIKFTSLLA